MTPGTVTEKSVNPSFLETQVFYTIEDVALHSFRFRAVMVIVTPRHIIHNGFTPHNPRLPFDNAYNN